MSFDDAPRLPGLGWLREPVNALTHGVGALLGVVGLATLLVLADGDPLKTVAAGVYGVSLVLLFLASTLLHALRVGSRALRALRLFDHAAIFGLIAGSYTPLTLVSLQERSVTLAWSLFGVVWGLALLGILFKVVWLHAPRWISVGLYLLLGWMALIAIGPLVAVLPPAALGWLVAGGLAYTVGAIVYATRRPDPFPRVFGYHELWHLFVLAGAASHFVLIARYVVAA
jgi:hemolysin III